MPASVTPIASGLGTWGLTSLLSQDLEGKRRIGDQATAAIGPMSRIRRAPLSTCGVAR
jgi:hypothetical protein